MMRGASRKSRLSRSRDTDSSFIHLRQVCSGLALTESRGLPSALPWKQHVRFVTRTTMKSDGPPPPADISRRGGYAPAASDRPVRSYGAAGTGAGTPLRLAYVTPCPPQIGHLSEQVEPERRAETDRRNRY